MLRNFALILFLFISGPLYASEACSGSTEEKLQCHSGEVKDFLRRWVRAWGEGDIDTYLSLYTTAKSPRDDLTREEWIQHRRARIGLGKEIELNLKLESMGLDVTVEQVQQGLSKIYPDGTDAVAQGVVIRELFRCLKQKMETS